jgi:hypothetical protein
MYRTRHYGNEIEEIEVLKRTDKTVTFNGVNRVEREDLVSSYHKWHETWDHAWDYLFNLTERDIENAQKAIINARETQEKLWRTKTKKQ